MDRIDRQVCGIETELAHYRRRPTAVGRLEEMQASKPTFAAQPKVPEAIRAGLSKLF